MSIALEKAIKILSELHDQCCQADSIFCTDTTGARCEAVDMAISALRAQDLQPTCNQLATDTISRQAAIDECNKRGAEHIGYAIAHLPSTQPENIRCYECKHGIHSGCGDVYICNVSPELVMEHAGDFYCGYAERKTDA